MIDRSRIDQPNKRIETACVLWPVYTAVGKYSYRYAIKYLNRRNISMILSFTNLSQLNITLLKETIVVTRT